MTFKYNGAGDFIMDASVAEDAVPLLLAFAVGGILFSISLTIFAVEVIRMGFHVVRAKGYGRWIDTGASSRAWSACCWGLTVAWPTWLPRHG